MLSIGSSFSSIEKPSVLFLLVGVAITHIVVPDIAAISEKLRTWFKNLKPKGEILPAGEWPAPDVNIHLVNLQPLLVMETLLTVRALESFVRIFCVSLLNMLVYMLHVLSTDFA